MVLYRLSEWLVAAWVDSSLKGALKFVYNTVDLKDINTYTVQELFDFLFSLIFL